MANRPGLVPGQGSRLLQILKWLVVPGAISCLAVGLYCYVTGPVSDLMRRWREAGYWLQGYDPIQVAHAGKPYLSEYGHMFPGDGYPPWAYVFALLTASPLLPFRVVKTLFLFLNVAAIAALGYFIRREYQSPGTSEQWPILFCHRPMLFRSGHSFALGFWSRYCSELVCIAKKEGGLSGRVYLWPWLLSSLKLLPCFSFCPWCGSLSGLACGVW